MATSQQRELMAQVEELGYTFKGRDKNNAVVLWHPTAGAVRIHATPSDNRYAMNKVSEARRKLRLGETRYGQFVDWLMEKYGIGKTDQKQLRLNIREDAREYLQSHPEGGRMESLVATVDQDPRMEVLERRQGQKTWEIRLTGSDYGIEDLIEELPDTTTVDTDNPMEAVIEQLRHMMVAEMNGELEDLRAKNELTISTLNDLLGALQGQRTEA